MKRPTVRSLCVTFLNVLNWQVSSEDEKQAIDLFSSGSRMTLWKLKSNVFVV
jgi:hypothetical protein